MVQSYLQEEVKELTESVDKSAQWQEMIDKLDLQGQRDLIGTTEKIVSPIPFLPMTNRIKNVLHILCPQTAKVEDYRHAPIPLDALALVLLAKDQQYFDKIEVWYSDRKTDPVAVGIVEKSDERQETKFLIARWGDERKEMHELEDEAIRVAVQDTTVQAQRQISEAKAILADPENHIRSKLDDMYFYL